MENLEKLTAEQLRESWLVPAVNVGGTEKTIQARQTSKGLRIRLEGQALNDAGLSHGTGIDIEIDSDNQQIVISRNPQGGRRVAGSASRPVIDIQSNKVNTIFNEGKVLVQFHDGAGIVVTQGG